MTTARLRPHLLRPRTAQTPTLGEAVPPCPPRPAPAPGPAVAQPAGPPRPHRSGPWLPRAVLLAVDVATFGVAMVVTGTTSVKTLTVLVLAVLLFSTADLYRPGLSLSVLDDAPALVVRSLAAGAGAMVLGGLGDGLAGTARLATAALFAGLCVGGRAVAYAGIRHARRHRRLQQRVLLLGAGAVAGTLGRNLLDHPEYGLTPVGLLDDEPLLCLEERPVPVLGGYADLSRVLVEHSIDVVIVSYGRVREPLMVDMLRACDHLACDIYFVPRLYELHVVTKDTEVLWGVPLVRLRRAPFRSPTWALKRVTDVVLAAVAMVLLLPVLLLCALLARWETGTVLFRQTRIGLDGRPFTLLKICSMRPVGETESGTRWTIADDERLGPVGRFLRRTSLDEIPQLWNVLRGDMSLVGPRPERPFFVGEFTRQFPWYMARHRVPAGLTGWAQIHGLRGNTSIADRARFDNFYIENWSIWGDVKIMIRTLGQVLSAGGR
ncbi:exopolysaccharide biosynthesis polyprenyl glycosylphosphotransferase [Geodermatophilus bullaregiensis]|uniref:sugar transferase n=1 Tax=Geodermatophilus bullaregiensis TaxID=1564160 RepID=UPI00195891BD|nr:sugar transferase [Geodermatophilus bullaregiensis]MBM7808960.1 exopolysaccharide biosynthesis polyprenyl glycosylphosphotransferase [Geodermatophilus bullaregiensis]